MLSTLVEHHRRFLKFLEARVGSREVAEDLLQAAFVKGLERGGDLHDGENAVAWFYRLLRNVLVDHWRRGDAERRALEWEATEVAKEVIPPPELEAALCECVYGLIPTLKDEYVEILRRVEMDGRKAVGDNGSGTRHHSRQRGSAPAPGSARAPAAAPDHVRHVHGAWVPWLRLRQVQGFRGLAECVMAGPFVRQQG